MKEVSTPISYIRPLFHFSLTLWMPSLNNATLLILTLYHPFTTKLSAMFVAHNWVYLFYMEEFQSQLVETKSKSWIIHAQASKFWCQNLSVPVIWSLLFFLIVFFLNTLSLCNTIATENHELLSSELKSIREKDLLIPIHMPGKLYHLNKFQWSVKLILLIVQTQVTCPTLELMERCQHYLKDTYSEW